MIKKRNENFLSILCPVILVTASDFSSVENIITIAWTGIVCSNPPCISISIKPNRYSYGLIKDAGKFGVNIPKINMIEQIDICGTTSGREIDKFSRCSFSKFYGEITKIPLINECPINLECTVLSIHELGSHHLFVSQILNKYTSEDYDDLQEITYIKPNYHYSTKEVLGIHGFSSQISNSETLLDQ